MRPFDSLLDIRILKDDVGTLATQLQRHLLQARRPHDFLTHSRGAGEGDFVDARVSHEGRTGRLSKAGKDVDDARRKPCFFDEGAEDEGRQGGLFGGFEDNSVSAGQCGGDFPSYPKMLESAKEWMVWGSTEHGEGEIPGDYLAADTERFVHCVLSSDYEMNKEGTARRVDPASMTCPVILSAHPP